MFLKESIFDWPMINLSALFNLTRSIILRLLLDWLLLADWLLLCSLPVILPLLGYNKNCQVIIDFYLKSSLFLPNLMASLLYPVLFRCNPRRTRMEIYYVRLAIFWSWPGGWDISWIKMGNRIRGRWFLYRGLRHLYTLAPWVLKKISCVACLHFYEFFGDKKEF